MLPLFLQNRGFFFCIRKTRKNFSFRFFSMRFFLSISFWIHFFFRTHSVSKWVSEFIILQLDCAVINLCQISMLYFFCVQESDLPIQPIWKYGKMLSTQNEHSFNRIDCHSELNRRERCRKKSKNWIHYRNFGTFENWVLPINDNYDVSACGLTKTIEY